MSIVKSTDVVQRKRTERRSFRVFGALLILLFCKFCFGKIFPVPEKEAGREDGSTVT